MFLRCVDILKGEISIIWELDIGKRLQKLFSKWEREMKFEKNSRFNNYDASVIV